jgi:Asp-tRNA(Asn)/Glu-tRNA(Gln) amidotransferase B subunit
MLERGGVVSGNASDFPDAEPVFLTPEGIRSILLVPVFFGARWWGLIGFDECTRERTWAQPEIEAQRAAASMLGAVIAWQESGLALEASPVTPAANAAILAMVGEGVISGKIAKDVFDIAWTSREDPRAIVESRGLRQVTDTGAIETAVDDIVAANPEKVAQAKAKPSLLGWFVGQVMKATGGKANPQAVNEVLRRKLGIE